MKRNRQINENLVIQIMIDRVQITTQERRKRDSRSNSFMLLNEKESAIVSHLS